MTSFHRSEAHKYKQKKVTIQLPQGTLVGAQYLIKTSREAEHLSLSSFKGIPYALPPVGNRRWKPAQPHPGWKGTKQALTFSPECVQPLAPATSLFHRHPRKVSEDCLYLNIWTPGNLSTPPQDQLPVMVWIHGGGLVEGSGSINLYRGTELAKKGVVVVTINYRLGVFGYFSHPELTERSPHNSSGNYGISDQIQALKWVRDNIEFFGGNPNNITIFGESAGALSVLHLLSSPLAKGLYHRAIAQSPYLMPLPELKTSAFGRPSAEDMGVNLAKAAKARNLQKLIEISPQELLFFAKSSKFVTDAVVDNWFLKEQLFETFEKGLQNSVPLLLGFNSGEGYCYEDYGWTAQIPPNPKSYIELVKNLFGKSANTYLDCYPPTDLREAVFAPIRDGFFGWTTETLARNHSHVNKNVYTYYFNHQLIEASMRGIGAFHSSEIPFVFNLVKDRAAYSENWPEYHPNSADLKMADIISNYWVEFSKNGNPDIANQPKWNSYNKEKMSYMQFCNGKASQITDPFSKVFKLHDKLIWQRRKQGNQFWWIGNIGLMSPQQ